MKKLLVLAFAVLCAISAIAADNVDILIKTNSEKIEAIIQEVSDTEVKYKKASNPNGPTYIVKLSELATIVYANGDVQAIEQKAEAAPQPAAQQPQPYYDGNNRYNYNNGYNYAAFDAKNGPMKHLEKDRFVIEGMLLEGKSLNLFLQENCPIAYEYHKKWRNCEIAGWSIFGAGLGLFIIGVGSSAGTNGPVAIIAPVLGAVVLSSIPLIACGDVNRKRTAEVFNAHCDKPQAFRPELHLQSSSDGLGLALHF